MSSSSDDSLSAWPCARATARGVMLDLSIVPGAKRTELVGLHDDALRVRLAAPPVDGKANDELLRWLAAQLGQPRRAVTLVRGASARRKQVLVDLPVATMRDWLSQQLPLP